MGGRFAAPLWTAANRVSSSRVRRAARSAASAATPMARIDEYTPASVPRSTTTEAMPSADSCCGTACGPAWTTTSCGRSCAISSVSGFMKLPTFGSRRTASGYRQKDETPTTRSPRPSANTISVMLGEVETIRAGPAASSGDAHRHNAAAYAATPPARRALTAKLVLQRHADPLQRKSFFLVVVTIEQVVHTEQHGVLRAHAIHRAQIDDHEIGIVDNRRARQVEVLVLPAVYVTGGKAARERSGVEVDAGADGIGRHVEDVPLAG